MKMQYLVVVMGYATSAALAGLPLPCVNYSGLLSDEYGLPILSDAAIELSVVRGGVTNRCDYHLIEGLIAPGVNFQLQLELDSGGTSYYAPYAVHVGDPVKMSVEVNGYPALVFPTNYTTLVAASPGEHVWLNIIVGRDADGDGLSDAWEELLMSQSGGVFTNIADIHPGDDFDGDGASNLHEFLAGTFPFLANDVFAIDQAELLNGRIRFEFLSIGGKVYQPQQTINLVDGTWSNALFAVTEHEDAIRSLLLGDGTFKTLYIDVDENSAFIRMSVK